MTDHQPPEGPQVRLDKEEDGTSTSATSKRGLYAGQSVSLPFRVEGHYTVSGPEISDVSTRKLVAALLAMFLGTLGLHKFYLGYTGAGLVLLLVNLGGWFMTFLLSIITLGIASIFLVPLMTLVSTVIAVCTIIEGVVYLSKTDADFAQTYLVGRREWF